MDLRTILAHRFEPVRHSYTFKDTILYALGIGYGADAGQDLRYVYEDCLQAVPSICQILAHQGFWLRDPQFAIDWVKILHGEQYFEIHRPLAPQGVVRGEYEVDAVEDRGSGKGAVLHQIKKLYDDLTDEHLATVRTVLMLRGDGGCGSYGTAPAPATPLSDEIPEVSVDYPTLAQSALIYRLSGDFNPIHADPAAAKAAGLGGPILHGLCTMGIAVRALLQRHAGNDPSRLRSMFVRFSKPVYPGETIRVETFGDGNRIRFRARSVERDEVVLDRGSAEIILA